MHDIFTWELLLPKTDLQIVFLVDVESGTEDILHDDHVRLVVVHRDAVHAQEVRQQRLTVTLNHVL